MKITLAHYSIFKITRTILGLGFILALVLGFLLLSYHGQFFAYVRSRGGIWFPMLAISSFGVAYYLVFEILLIRQILFDQRRALWVEDGVVVYLHRLYLARRCNDIVAVSARTDGRFKFNFIVLQMRDGSQKLIPSDALLEPQQEVIEKLKRQTGTQ